MDGMQGAEQWQVRSVPRATWAFEFGSRRVWVCLWQLWVSTVGELVVLPVGVLSLSYGTSSNRVLFNVISVQEQVQDKQNYNMGPFSVQGSISGHQMSVKTVWVAESLIRTMDVLHQETNLKQDLAECYGYRKKKEKKKKVIRTESAFFFFFLSRNIVATTVPSDQFTMRRYPVDLPPLKIAVVWSRDIGDLVVDWRCWVLFYLIFRFHL
ncbi:hypothetical protein V8F33_003425 [Rhypophila sp. PSN 637]